MSMDLTESVFHLMQKASTELPPDVKSSLKSAQEAEEGTTRGVMDDIKRNVGIAGIKCVPMCQDTGALNFFVRKGDFPEDELKIAIDEAVCKATRAGLLRPNSVDPIAGKNLGNIPLVHFEEGAFEIGLLLKGGGSENVGAQYSLPNNSLNAGRDLEGVEKCVLDAVFRAQGEGCPPYFIGVCIGGQRESGHLEAKKQLFRKAGERDCTLGDFEAGLKNKINKLGIGPMGLGGKVTALEVFATSLSRHPACYFVSISLNCWALRRWTLTEKNGKAHYS